MLQVGLIGVDRAEDVRGNAEAGVEPVAGVGGVVDCFGYAEGYEFPGKGDEVVEALEVKVTFNQAEGGKGGGVSEAVLEKERMKLLGRVNGSTGDGEVPEGWVEEDNGVMSERIERTVFVDKVEGA